MNSCALSIKLWLAEGHQIGHFGPPQKTTSFSIKTFHRFDTFWSNRDRPHFDMFFFGVHESNYSENYKVFLIFSLNIHHEIIKILKKTTRIFTILEKDIFHEISKLSKSVRFYNKKSPFGWSVSLLQFHVYTYFQRNLNI